MNGHTYDAYTHIIIGPKHMKQFAEDQMVQSKFIEAALSRCTMQHLRSDISSVDGELYSTSLNNIFTNMHTEPEEQHSAAHPIIELMSADPEMYRGSTLYKLIPLLANPRGIIQYIYTACPVVTV